MRDNIEVAVLGVLTLVSVWLSYVVAVETVGLVLSFIDSIKNNLW